MYLCFMVKTKICAECNKKFSESYGKYTAKYCSEDCKKKVRSRVQKKCREVRKKRKSTDLDYCSQQVFNKYRSVAPKRGLEFELTVQDFRNNIEEPCFYCGIEYDGIGFDRVKNDIGYKLENVVPCCGYCNRMKRSQTQEEFLERCKKIASNHNGK